MTQVRENGDQYPQYSKAIKEYFQTFMGKVMFRTTVEDLFEAFLNGLTPESRQHYNCDSCRHFINHYGNLVSIDDKGQITSAIWNENVVPEFFAASVKAMRELVEKATVLDTFYSSDMNLGRPESNGWGHMHLQQHRTKVWHHATLTAGQQMAAKRAEFKSLKGGLDAFSLDNAIAAVDIAGSGTLNRSDLVLPRAQWFKDLYVSLEGVRSTKTRDNLIWLAVASAPSGFCSVKGGMLGVLLKDIAEGLSFDAIKRSFDGKVAADQYMRAQTPPPQGNINHAEKLIAEYGLEDSLRRRYATIDEIPQDQILWEGHEEVVKDTPKAAPKTGVFANVAAREKVTPAPAASNVIIPPVTMTWDKFNRTVLGTADKLEVLVDSPNRFMAIVTEAVANAKNILRWGNPFSWYYHKGIDGGEVKRRVERAGGQYEDVEIRCSLIWEGHTDLDLHCHGPKGHIFYGNKRNHCGGYLDIDMNGGAHRDASPVENIRWAKGRAPRGRYEFRVHNFAERGLGKERGNTPYQVQLEINGEIFIHHGVAGSTGFDTLVFAFDYVKGEVPNVSGDVTSNNSWSVPVGGFVKVNAITTSPNLWGENTTPSNGQHVFFLLEGCKDISEGKGRGFFAETLIGELHEIRRTLEGYTASTPIEDAENASASGVGYSKESEWNLTVKVTSGNSTRLIKIDRFD